MTSFRFFAALYVVLFHLPIHFHLPEALERVFGRVLGFGYTSVGFFFVLSGFILAYSYAGRSRPVDNRTFWTARFARVYPVYALAMLLALPSFFEIAHEVKIGAVARVAHIVAGFALLQSWSPSTVGPFNIPSWSLSVEALFYLTFPFALSVLLRIPERSLRTALVLLALAAVVVSLPASLMVPEATPYTWSGLVTWVKFFPPIHLPQFLFGMVLGRLFLLRPPEAVPGWHLALLGWGAIVALVAISQVPGLYLVKHTGGLVIFHGALIWALAHERGPSARLLAKRSLVLLGEASYGIYILHFPLFYFYPGLLDALLRGRTLPPFTNRLGFIVTTSLVAILVYRFYELPAREWIRARFTRLNPQPVA